MEPKFIQIFATPYRDIVAVFALDEVGSVWEYANNIWVQLKPTRQETAPPSEPH